MMIVRKRILRRRKVLFVNSHSTNNRDIFELTAVNHSRYCEAHNYELLNVCEPYRRTVDMEKLRNLLRQFDYVAYVGSDILFTEFNKKLEDFTLGEISACREQCDGGCINGDFVIFRSDAQHLAEFDAVQQQKGCLQMSMNARPDLITEVPRLQLADPAINTRWAGKLWKPGDYCIHFHHYGIFAMNGEKKEYIQKFRETHPEYF